jgi:hypothetical protein
MLPLLTVYLSDNKFNLFLFINSCSTGGGFGAGNCWLFSLLTVYQSLAFATFSPICYLLISYFNAAIRYRYNATFLNFAIRYRYSLFATFFDQCD